jgi:hypothetical protein
MKMKTLSVLAGVSAPLIMAAPSDAGFVGINWTKKPNAFGLMTVNVYAEFTNAGADQMQAVAGTPNAPLNITVIGGSFWNQNFGADQAPQAALVAAFPSLAYDSFYTIGRKVIDPPGGEPNALNLVNMPVLAGTSVSTSNGSWGLVPPTAGQGNPFDGVNSFPGNGNILIGQFSMEIPATGTYGIVGQFLLQYVSDGEVGQSYVSFENIVPTPGALGLLGVAGLIGRRRRRR